VRGWTHLERQRGGSIGLRGPGETQLETDRRLLQKRVEQLQKRLEKVEVQRTQMRRARVRSELPRVALVGYTNAGKSTLFNAMTGAEADAALGHGVAREVEVVQAVKGFLTAEIHELYSVRLCFGRSLHHQVLVQRNDRG
jgi:GTP-binding protein HflX